jgi:type II secretory pathway pseudopilin PulG
LVVIAIIALLMAILMPALSKAKQQAKAAACLVQLKQWANAFAAYTDNNQGNFWTMSGTPGWAYDWVGVMRRYYGENFEGWCCPAANKTSFDKKSFAYTGKLGIEAAWGAFSQTNTTLCGTNITGAYGSYGTNTWVSDPGQDPYFSGTAGNFWKTTMISKAQTVPLMLDSFYHIALPIEQDSPPPFRGSYSYGNNGFMETFCLDRHTVPGETQGIFMDYSARKIGLKELWRLKWNRNFHTDCNPPDWKSQAPWMVKFKDYTKSS